MEWLLETEEWKTFFQTVDQFGTPELSNYARRVKRELRQGYTDCIPHFAPRFNRVPSGIGEAWLAFQALVERVSQKQAVTTANHILKLRVPGNNELEALREWCLTVFPANIVNQEGHYSSVVNPPGPDEQGLWWVEVLDLSLLEIAQRHITQMGIQVVEVIPPTLTEEIQDVAVAVEPEPQAPQSPLQAILTALAQQPDQEEEAPFEYSYSKVMDGLMKAAHAAYDQLPATTITRQQLEELRFFQFHDYETGGLKVVRVVWGPGNTDRLSLTNRPLQIRYQLYLKDGNQLMCVPEIWDSAPHAVIGERLSRLMERALLQYFNIVSVSFELPEQVEVDPLTQKKGLRSEVLNSIQGTVAMLQKAKRSIQRKARQEQMKEEQKEN